MTSLLKRTLLALASLIIVVMLAIAAAGCGSTADDSANASAGAGTGASKDRQMAPDFYINTLDNGMMSLADIRAPGKPIVLNVGASWCDPCKVEAPILAAEYQKYKDRVTFFGFAEKDKEDDQRAFATEYGLVFPVGLDTSSDNGYNYEKAARVPVSGIPTTYFIDKDGYIVDYYIGPLTEQKFEQKVSEILPAGVGSTSTSASSASGR